MSVKSPQSKAPFLLGSSETLEEIEKEEGGVYYRARSLQSITGYFVRREMAEAWLEDCRRVVK